MKKTLLFTLTFLLTALVNFSSFGQCTPDEQYTEPGAYPNELADGCVNKTYEDTIHFVYPKDTTIMGTTVDIDSAQLESIDNVPAGLNYECNTNNCKYIADKEINRGCIAIDGTPEETMSPSDSLTLNVKVWGQGFSNTEQMKVGLNIKSEGECKPSGNQQFNSSANSLVINLYPKPLSSGNALKFKINQSKDFSIDIYNAIGKKVLHIPQKSYDKGVYVINENDIRNNLFPGMYFVKFRFKNGKDSIVKKLSVRE